MCDFLNVGMNPIFVSAALGWHHVCRCHLKRQNRVKVGKNGTRMAETNESTAQPVGLEYIEEDRTGKVVQFHCKLCDCKFNDPNAKEMHLKGRRHRLQYKKKVDPSLDVDMKPSIRARRVQDERSRQQRVDFWRRRDLEERMQEMQAMEWSNYWGMRPGWNQPPSPGVGAAVGPMRAAAGGFGFPLSPQHHVGGRPRHAGPGGGKRVETVDDKHVQAKHASIYPSEDELKSVQHLVSTCEKALKLVSDDLAEEAAKAEEAVESQQNGQPEGKRARVLKTVVGQTRQLKGVVRTGALANGLMLHHDLNVELVLLSAMRPSVSFLYRVHDNFVRQIKTVAPDDSFEIHKNAEGCGLLVLTTKAPITTCVITFTSPMLREYEEDSSSAHYIANSTVTKMVPLSALPNTEPQPKNGETVADPEADQMTEVTVPNDPLDKDKCLAALAALRRSKWFAAKCSGRQNIVVVIRVMRDLCARVPTWSPLGQWPLELLVEKVISSAPPNLGLGEALRRLFECIAAGTFLTSGPGLLDPCERTPVDALHSLSPQEREDITASAQHALRLIAFRQIHKVLDMEPLPPPGSQQTSIARSRPSNCHEVGEKRPASAIDEKSPPSTVNHVGGSDDSSPSADDKSSSSLPPSNPGVPEDVETAPKREKWE